MALDYKRIRDDKEQEYGTKVGNYGRLLANLYSDRTHFIFELLQNAEDALRDRGPGWGGSRAVSFNLTKNELRVDHLGRPFNEADVRGICEIGESTKADDLTAIGRFGIGFKSVYAITDRPEIHSGPEDFAIEDYVLPVAVPGIERGVDDTVFLLPLKSNEASVYGDIAAGFKGFGSSSLLFLRQIDEVQWRIDDGRSGHYLRESNPLDEGIRHVTVIGQVFGELDVSTEWLVFSRPVARDDGGHAGHVELAFLLDSGSQKIQPIGDSRLVVFFPTTLDTRLGFLIQGPYQTTPSRDNVPSHVPWNRHLVKETSLLLIEALRWLRDKGHLTTDVLRCLPLSASRFGGYPGPSSGFLNASPIQSNMFAPLFHITKQALSSEPLLPSLNSGYIPAKRALLGRTDGIRQLFSSSQLAALYGSDQEMAWLSSDITQDRTPEIREYLMGELGVEEIDPETITRKLTGTFLENQPDDWVLKLYEFLSTQPAISRILTGQAHRSYSVRVPLVRLTDGRHVCLGEPQAFLPSEGKTDFPTVSPAVCGTSEARSFLRSLGLREPDLVDDVEQNVLPKYRQKEYQVDDVEYEADMARIIKAFATDSTAQREELVGELRRSRFVKSIAPGTSKAYLSKPVRVYLATESMKELFRGVEEVRIVDDGYGCLRGQQAEELLEACGATSHLKPIPIDSNLTNEERHRMRQGDRSTRPESVSDWMVMGLDRLLDQLPLLPVDDRRERASRLWEALIDLVEEEGSSPFWGTYRWHYYSWHSKKFAARFVQLLNERDWVPDEGGRLRRPDSVVFASLDWEEHSFLLSQIPFMPTKPPIVDTLARKVGIEPESLDLIKKHRVTPEMLREWIGLNEDPLESGVTSRPLGPEGARQGEPQSDDRTREGASGSTSTKDDGTGEPFARVFFGVSAEMQPASIISPVIFAEGGPTTEESAKRHTQQSGQFGRSGMQHRVSATRWEPTEAAKTLADEFKMMVHGDYGRRCQVCGMTFRMWNGDFQTFVVHVVEPKGDSRTNHLGDLMSLCAQHFALVRYGVWTWLNPETGTPFEDSEGREAWEHWRNFVLDAEGTDAEKTDIDGNTYIGFPIRFWNIYQEWNAEPELVDGVVRYNKPHWKYLCELLKT